MKSITLELIIDGKPICNCSTFDKKYFVENLDRIVDDFKEVIKRNMEKHG